MGISIQGLTARQMEMMNEMWALERLDEVHSYIEDLDDEQDRFDALSLVEIATLESLEEDGAIKVYEDLARSIVDHARRM